MLLLGGIAVMAPVRAQSPYDVQFGDGVSAGKNPRISGFRVLQQEGARPRFSPDGTSVVFDRQTSNGPFDVYLMNAAGEITTSLTEGNPGIPQWNNGNAIFDPSGKYIVFLSESPNPISGVGNPGVGIFCNFWATDLKGAKFWQLTDIPVSILPPYQAYVNPNFSLDGSTFVWTNRYGSGGNNNWGLWRLLSAPYSSGADGPKIGATSVLFQPNDAGKGNYVTSMGFLDSTHLLTPGNLDGQNEYGMDEYILDTVTKKFVNLTNSPKNWEEGACISPNKQWIVYMDDITSPFALDFTNANWPSQPLEREYWLVQANGAYRERLTYLNDPAAPEYLGQYGAGRIAVESCDFSPDGTSLVGTLAVDFGTATTADLHLKVIKIEFSDSSLFTATGAPSLSGDDPVVNAGSFKTGFASSGWISIFGSNLAPDTRMWRSQDFVSNQLPTSLDGVSVQINGKPAFVSYISPRQLNVLAPDDTAEGPVSVQVSTGGGKSAVVTAMKQEFAPGLFTFPADGGRYAAAQHSLDYSLIGSPNLYPGQTTPAKPGEVILIYGTGFGPVSSPLPAGQLVKNASRLASQVTVTIGGVDAPVQYAGRSASGLDQLNVTVPTVGDGDQPVTATVGGAPTQAGAYITIQQ